MAGVWEQVQTFFWNIIHRPTWIDYIDIAIIAFLIYQLVTLTRQTRASQVLKGLAVLLVLRYVSELIRLHTLSSLINAVLSKMDITNLSVEEAIRQVLKSSLR